MIRYMLDTNIVSYAMKRKSEAVLARLDGLPSNVVGISSIVLAELEFGVASSPRRARDEVALQGFLRNTAVLPFPESACATYGIIRAELKRKGLLIGANDTLIAAHALSEDVILVTNNTREFERIPGLLLENWTEAAH